MFRVLRGQTRLRAARGTHRADPAQPRGGPDPGRDADVEAAGSKETLGLLPAQPRTEDRGTGRCCVQLQEPGRLCRGLELELTGACLGVCGHQMPGCLGPNSRKRERCQVFYKIGHNLTILRLKGSV